MATIALEPTENFEHFHDVESITILRKGVASLTINNVESVMALNQIVNVPAMVLHTLKNMGQNVCIFECNHGGSGRSV